MDTLNRELTIRERDGTATTRPIGSADELLAVLDESFGLRFPPGTRFGTALKGEHAWPTA